MSKRAFVHLSSDVSETSDNADQQRWNLKWDLWQQDLGKWCEKMLLIIELQWRRVSGVNRSRLSEQDRLITHTECAFMRKKTACDYHLHLSVCVQWRHALTETHTGWKIFLTTVHFGQDVGSSPRFILLRQTQGGPHQAGKLHGTTLLFFQQHRFSPLKCIWIQMYNLLVELNHLLTAGSLI